MSPLAACQATLVNSIEARNADHAVMTIRQKCSARRTPPELGGTLGTTMQLRRRQSASESRAETMGEIFDPNNFGRCSYIGGSDARTIMGHDEAPLIRLWREKRGEIDAEDLSANLVVQFGVATEELNRRWFERETGRRLGHVQRFVRHPKLDCMGATLDGTVKE